MRQRRLWWLVLVAVAFLVAAAAGTVLAVAVNVATGATSPRWPQVEAHPVWWMAGATVAVVAAGGLGWWAQRLPDQGPAALVPVSQRPEPWVVDRPAEVRAVVPTLLRGGSTVDITTAVTVAKGFGKAVVAKLVRADRRVLRRFDGRVHLVTLGWDERSRAALAEKVNDLLTRSELAAGPPRLLVLDDVWHPERETPFPVTGVDQVTPEQARAMLTVGLPSLPRLVVAAVTSACCSVPAVHALRTDLS